MKHLAQLCTAAIGAVALSGCVEESGTRDSGALRDDASNAAETVCMQTANRNYGGNAQELTVVR